MIKIQTAREISEAKWRLQTEYIISVVELGFSLFIFFLYFSFNTSLGAENKVSLTRIAVASFPLICLARLAYVHWCTPGQLFGWVSMIIDIAFLTGILFIFSLQYATPAASLKAPSFSFYFIFIALHAMRFRLRLVIASGLLTVLAWGSVLAYFVLKGEQVTRSYADYISTTQILIGAEVEKIAGLLIFTIMMAIGVKRAGDSLKDAAQKKISEVKMVEAEKTAKLKTEFLANMSHEIRTPMNGVLGMAQVLRSTSLDREQTEFVDTIQRSGDALLTIINDILDFSKIDSGKLRLDSIPFDLREACEDVVTLLGVTARDKGIELLLNINPNVPVKLMGDPGRFRQVLTNLIGNAIKFTQAGYVLCEIEGVESEGEARLSVSIQDTGVGIAPDQLENIFSEFAQADNSTTRRFGGTGLGLSISRSLVALMGGDVTVTSELGVGSKFTFTATLVTDRRRREGTARANVVDLADIPILVLDDLDVNSNILRLQLKQLGARPHIVANARDAVSAIVKAYNSGTPYGIVVSDYQMPDIDGLEFVTALRNRPIFDHVEIIVLSSIDDAKVKQSFGEHNVTAYMTKPYRQTDLQDAIYTAAARYNANRLMDIARKECKDPRVEEGQGVFRVRTG